MTEEFLVFTAKVMFADSSRSVGIAAYCVDSMHVFSVGNGIHGETKRKVVPCDHTCEGNVECEVELPDELVNFLHKQLSTDEIEKTK